MGISIYCPAWSGGLTIIPGGMKSTVNIVGGGRTLWANGYYGLTMLFLLVAGTGLINRIPPRDPGCLAHVCWLSIVCDSGLSEGLCDRQRNSC